MLVGVDMISSLLPHLFSVWARTHAESELAYCCVLMPGCRIGAKVANALALELGYLGQLTVLDLTGEQFNGGKHKVW